MLHNKRSHLVILIFVHFSCSVVSAQIIAPGKKLHLVDSSFAFAEGPATDRWGNVFFTDQPNDNIWRYDTSSSLSLYFHGAHRSNGMYFDAKGNLVSCADENNELISISPDKKITVLAKGFQGHALNGPNDVWINRNTGGIYITDPYFQRDYWTRTGPDTALHGEKIYYLPRRSHQLQLLDSAIGKPNGIVGSADGRYLYVADMSDWKTYRYTIMPDGSLSNKMLFINEASDGMTVDQEGHIYLTGKGVMVYDSTGKKITQIDVPEKWTGNLCFAGKNKNVLFITASKSVYVIQTLMKGVE